MNRLPHVISGPVIVLGALLAVRSAAMAQAPPPGDGAVDSQSRIPFALADASQAERTVLQRLYESGSWVRRAVAALRLERYQDDESKDLLVRLLDDPAWQVRSFAVRVLGRRGVKAEESWFTREQEPRVIRTALRYRYVIDPARLERGIRHLIRSGDLEENLLGVELGAASGDESLSKLVRDPARKIILRMNRIEAGALSPRLALLTQQPDLRNPHRWREWVMKAGRRFELFPVYALKAFPQPGLVVSEGGLSLLATLESDRFAAMEDYMVKLRQRKLDLAIALDCTASMGGEIAAAQGGIDDMMLFVSDVVGSLRIAIVGYRDRHDDFKTKAWDFTDRFETAREQLWMLTAEGGGDSPEAVFDAMRLVYQQFTWLEDTTKVLVLIGDAPPHVGYGANCIEMAKKAHDIAQLTTHVIQADGKEVKHFSEIAEAGGGTCVTLENDDALITELTGLTLGDTFQEEFREFFRIYLELCR